jgi:hypothetical protein
LPSCQETRQDKAINKKIIAFAEQLRSSKGMINGVIVLGHLPDDPNTYLVDGTQRRKACNMCGLDQFYCDIREIWFPNVEALALEYLRINDQLVRHTADDRLIAYEAINPWLSQLRARCPYIGYNQVRRAISGGPVVGMSVLLRAWFGSAQETPSQASGQSVDLCALVDQQEFTNLTRYLKLAYAAWGSEPEYYPLWTALNLIMTMWLFRQLVLNRDIKRRIVMLNDEHFKNCLMSLSASTDYLTWMPGRKMTERDRSPCYTRLRSVFIKRIILDTNIPPLLPQPYWFSRKTRRMG